MKKIACSECGATGRYLMGHHPDYQQPKHIVPICSSCHQKLHNRSPTLRRPKRFNGQIGETEDGKRWVRPSGKEPSQRAKACVKEVCRKGKTVTIIVKEFNDLRQAAVKVLRKEGFSLRQIGSMLGVSGQYIGKLVAGIEQKQV